MTDKNPRCLHVPVRLYDEPSRKDIGAWLFYGDKADWVICSRCRTTGYWGGYGAKRRIRWNVGWKIEESAAEWNRWVAGRAAEFECTDTTKEQGNQGNG